MVDSGQHYFFSKNPKFWLYHSVGLLAYVGAELVLLALAPSSIGFRLLGSVVLWPALFTLVVLSFRWLYKTGRIFSSKVGLLIPQVIIASGFSALLASTVVVAILMPFFWRDFASPAQLASGGVDLVFISYPVILNASLFGHLFFAAWMFIYIIEAENRSRKKTELDNEKLQSSLREAQINSLSNQLNPHFLFNSLNNIRFMIHESPAKADDMVVSLSEMLRFNLESHRSEKLPLKEELRFSQKYLDIVKMQYEEKMQVVKIIPECFYSCLVPPLCVQILLENAVKHGFEFMDDGGELKIVVFETDKKLSIQVSNPIPAPDSRSANSIGVGLKNIRERLQLLYGNKGHLHTEYKDLHFIACVTFPLERLT